MSWRTPGLYKGLTRESREWLRKFDRKWDTKAQGRTREDAFDHMGDDCSNGAIRPKSVQRTPKIENIPAPEAAENGGEVDLSALSREIYRYTVPKQTQRKWSIHLVLRSGKKIRVQFKDEEEAQRAYQIIEEAFSILLAA